MGLGGSIGNIAKKLATTQPAYIVGKRIVDEAKKNLRKGRAGSTSRTSADISARKKKDYRKQLQSVDRQGMRRRTALNKYAQGQYANKMKMKAMKKRVKGYKSGKAAAMKHKKEQDAYRK